MAFHVLKMATNYEGSHNRLAGCLNDCFDTDKVLGHTFTSKAVLRGAECTKANMLVGVEQVVARCEPGDEWGVFWSGHGMSIPSKIEADGHDEAILSNDMQPVFDDELYLRFARSKPGVTGFLWTDSCHADGMIRDNVAGIQRSIPFDVFAQQVSPDELQCALDCGARARSEWAQERADIVDRIVHFAGCGPYEFSMDARFGPERRANGAFTYYALATYAKLEAERTYLGWMSEVRRYLPSNQYNQTPVARGDLTRIVRGKEPPSSEPSTPASTSLTFSGQTSDGRKIRGTIE